MQPKNNSTLILLISILNAILCSLGLMAIAYFKRTSLSLDFLLLTLFLVFISSFAVVYYYYYYVVDRRMLKLAEKIKDKFLSKDIPIKENLLDETDHLTMLDNRVDLLIDAREREHNHFENLDSYRKEYLGNVSHELKTPIFNIQGYIDTLLNGGLEDPEINVDYLHRAEKSVDRLINIIDDLETITQLESGEMHLELDKFDIAALCKDIYDQLEIQASKKNISLKLAKKYEKPIYVQADKFRIRQVLVNLITNSIKYGVANGQTLISISNYNDDVIIEVSDNGVGIEEKHLPRLFERFYRIDKGRSREQGGTGLGLAIVKHILEAHHKSINVESELGKGTKFTFSLKAVISN